MKPESLVYYAIMGVVLAFAFSRMSGQPLSMRLRREPTIWDIAWLIFAVSIPLVAQFIGDGFLAGIVLVLAAIAIVFASRRYGQTRTEPTSPATR